MSKSQYSISKVNEQTGDIENKSYSSSTPNSFSELVQTMVLIAVCIAGLTFIGMITIAVVKMVNSVNSCEVSRQ